jgi:hypothetical protein
MVEQEAVNFEVAGSSPAGAKHKHFSRSAFLLLLPYDRFPFTRWPTEDKK